MDFIRHEAMTPERINDVDEPYNDEENPTLVVQKDRDGKALIFALSSAYDVTAADKRDKMWTPVPKSYTKEFTCASFVDNLSERNGDFYFKTLSEEWTSIKRNVVDTEPMTLINLDTITRAQITGWKLDGELEPLRSEFIVVSPEEDSEYHEIPALDWSLTNCESTLSVVGKSLLPPKGNIITTIDEGDDIWKAIPNLDWKCAKTDEEVASKDNLPLTRFFSRAKKLASGLMASSKQTEVLKHLQHFCIRMDLNKDSLTLMNTDDAAESSGTLKDHIVVKKARADALYAEIFPVPPHVTSKLIYDENFDVSKARKFVVIMLTRRLKHGNEKVKSLQTAALQALSVFNKATAKFNAEWNEAISDDDENGERDVCKPPHPPPLLA